MKSKDRENMQNIDSQLPFEQIDLPNIFGKCLGIEKIDPLTIQIKSLRKKPQKEAYEAEIIEYANEALPLSGKLTTDERGFTYLALPNEYIYELLPFLENGNATSPPYFDGLHNAGAHVSVILASESHDGLDLAGFSEEIPFSLTGCYFVEPENWLEMETIWFLTIKSPNLCEIRTRLHLSPYIENKEFHITFAVKKRFFSIHELLGKENEAIFIKNIF